LAEPQDLIDMRREALRQTWFSQKAIAPRVQRGLSLILEDAPRQDHDR
jgi:hypothetical protein